MSNRTTADPAPPETGSNAPPSTLLLTGLVALAPLSIDMFLPSLPAMVSEYGADAGRLQLAVTLFLMSFAASQLFFGPVSDRIGRRKGLLAGLLFYTLASAGCALAPTIDGLLGARILQGFAAGSGPVLARAIVRDVYRPEKGATVLANMGMVMALAPILAPIGGGYLHILFGWRSVFLVLSALGAAYLAAAWFLLPETHHDRDPDALKLRKISANLRRLLTHRQYLGYIAIISFRFGGQLVFITSSSFVLIDFLGLPPQVFGFSFALVAFGIMNGAFLSGRLTTRWGINRVILTGSCISTAFSLLLAGLAWSGVYSVWSIVLPMFAVTVGSAMVLPPATAGAIAPFKDMAGLASAVMGFLQMSGGSLYTIGVGWFHDGTPLPMVTAIALANIFALGAFFLLAPYREESAT